MFLIGLRYGVTVDTMLKANCRDSTFLRSGETLRVPPVTPRPLPTLTQLADTTPAVPAVLSPTGTLTATDGACSNPDSVIASPKVGTLLMSTTLITGTARSRDFSFYKLELRQEGTQQSFATAFTIYEPVVDGTLAELNTLDWPNGEYWLRLVVVDNQNNYIEPCSILIAFYNL